MRVRTVPATSVAIVAISIAPALIYFFLTPPVYEATAIMGYSAPPVYQFYEGSNAGSVIDPEHVGSLTVLYPVIEKLGLNGKFHRHPKLEKPYGLETAIQFLYEKRYVSAQSKWPLDLTETYGEMMKHLQITRHGDFQSGNTLVRWTGSDPKLTVAIPNAIATSHVAHVAEHATRIANNPARILPARPEPKAWIISLAKSPARRISPKNSVAAALLASGILAGLIGIFLRQTKT